MSTVTESVTIALTRGRILKETLPLLREAGIEPLEDMSRSRKLKFATSLDQVSLLVMRGSDVPVYVENGAADMGVAGKDMLLEYGGEGLYEPLDLGIARCRLMIAAPQEAPASSARLRVATKFTGIAKRWFAEQGRQVELIKLNGALEIAPAMGLADAIVDIVDTGNTLRANGLEPRETIAEISSRVIVNKASMKIKSQLIRAILERLAASVNRRAS
ncbi:MAG: ATP phosphoribosyltransferase [Gammaproteobacteria bacterium]|nr:ATP phosphoribosyltransferase [Gammaproteobacteria bacterium]MYH84853.1 ATP phosphoribosyltransferase [Gammaproteobacteria bacterium]MYK05444.1 ATP phosphoribosyltransferase [Gammaproteobacteria bacterium]